MDSSLLLKRYLVVVTSFVSFLSTWGCILTYIVKKDLHTLGFRLIMGLAISNFILSLGHLLTTFTLFTDNKQLLNIICDIQAPLVNFSQLTSIFWIAALAWIMYVNIIIRKRNLIRRARVYYIIIFTLGASFTVGY